MKSYFDIENWNRKQHFHHFKNLADPYFGVVVDVDVTNAFQWSKKNKTSFFVVYLYACMKAINAIENFKYRIENDKVAIYNIIHASATIARPDSTFGFSYIEFSEDFEVFNQNFNLEKERICSSSDLFPPIYSEGCIHCSALPWMNFSAHKEPISGVKDESIPKLSFGKIKENKYSFLMPVAINVNHALVDGYHVGEFFEKYQHELNKFN